MKLTTDGHKDRAVSLKQQSYLYFLGLVLCRSSKNTKERSYFVSVDCWNTTPKDQVVNHQRPSLRRPLAHYTPFVVSLSVRLSRTYNYYVDVPYNWRRCNDWLAATGLLYVVREGRCRLAIDLANTLVHYTLCSEKNTYFCFLA